MAQRMGAGSTEDGKDPAASSRIDELEQQISFLRHALEHLSPSIQGLKGRDAPGLIGYAADPPACNTITGKPRQPRASGTRAKLVRDYVSRRKMRSELFPCDYFADPVWDMLLDLYAAHHEDRLVSVSSLCIASGVPATTALRWIKTLTSDGSLIRSRDDSDGRRVYIHLGPATHSKLDAYFNAVES